MHSFDFYSDAFFPDWTGGLQRYATELASVAGEQGYGGALWTREWRRRGLEEIQDSVGPRIKVHSVLRRVPHGLRGAVLTSAGLCGIRLGRPTAEVSIFHTSVLASTIMGKGIGSKQIYVFHASAGHELLTEALSRGPLSRTTQLKAGVLLRLERNCLRSADAIVVLSEFSKALLQNLHPEIDARKVVIIPGGTTVALTGDPGRVESLVRARRILVLRRLEWRMGIDMLLEAFADSQARVTGWKLDIVGTGSQAESLRKLSSKLGISDQVVFHGRVSEARRAELLNVASLSVLPTRALEGFGLATVEAMAMGVVPIVTSAGASPEIVKSLDERLVCAPSPKEIRKSLDYWAVETSNVRLEEVRAACRQRAQNYGWNVVFQAYQALVRDLLDTERRKSL